MLIPPYLVVIIYLYSSIQKYKSYFVTIYSIFYNFKTYSNIKNKNNQKTVNRIQYQYTVTVTDIYMGYAWGIYGVYMVHKLSINKKIPA